MRFLFAVLIVVNVDATTMASAQLQAVYSVKYCIDGDNTLATFNLSSRAECAIKCLNYGDCFGFVSSPSSSVGDHGRIESCQLKAKKIKKERCPYRNGQANFYHQPVDACDLFGFIKFEAKCYRYSRDVTAVPEKIDSECKKFDGARAVLPGNQNELDTIVHFLKSNYPYVPPTVWFDYTEESGIIRIRDGPQVTFSKDVWKVGEPNNAGEKCVLLTTDYKFQDYPCNSAYNYICVMDNV